MQEHIWQIDGHVATLTSAPLRGRIDLHAPHRGLHNLSFAGRALNGAEVLGVAIPIAADEGEVSLADFYCRGRDLVVTYVESAAHPLRTQVYWRGTSVQADANGTVGAGLELLTSVQTHLLDSDPSITTHSRFPTGGIQRMSFLEGGAKDISIVPLSATAPDAELQPGEGFQIQPEHGDWMYYEMVHPNDLHDSAGVTSSESATISHRLFRERLEKGVILRSRIRGLLLTQDINPTRVQQFFAEFAAAELPLTT